MAAPKEIDIDQLIPDDKNANKGTKKGSELIEKSFQELGAGRSVLLDKNNRLIDGNKSTDAARKAGIKKVRIIETDGTELIAVKRTDVDLDSKQGRELAIADNSSALASIEFDYQVLEEIAELEGVELQEWGIDESFTKADVKDDNYVPDFNIETDIVFGDLFELKRGDLKHRLLCGDSTDTDLVSLLMNGEKADLVFTDPDFSMPIELMIEVYDTSLVFSKGIGFWLGGDKQVVKLANHDFENFSKCFVQDFRNATILSNDQPMTRTVLIAQMGRKKMNNLHDAFSTLLQIPTDRVSEQHKLTPMSKKIELPYQFIIHFTQERELVLDFFGHSGSTMVAAHQTNRRCNMIEIEPRFCQVIINRMKEFDPEIEITRINRK